MAVTRIKSGSVDVEGLRELQRALRELPKEHRRELTKANKEAANIVTGRAKARAFSLGGVAAHVAPGIRASAGQTSAGVAFGGPAYPMAGGAEFGSIKYKQFAPWRGNGPDAGYFVYPTIRDDAGEWIEPYEESIRDAIKRAGLD